MHSHSLDIIQEIGQIMPMTDEEIIITTEDVQEQINKTKGNKAPGPDGIKPEIIKLLQPSKKYIEELNICLSNVIIEEEILESWRTSNTSMIPRERRPKPKDLRPIALTDTTYKLFMGIVKTKTQRYVIQSGQMADLQSSYIQQRRISDNLYIVRYCIDQTFKIKNALIIIKTDFEKTFDSVNRSKLVDSLMKVYHTPKNYKHPNEDILWRQNKPTHKWTKTC